LHKAKGSNSCERPAGGSDARPGSAPGLARPLRGGEQRFTVRHHAEALLQLRRATVHNASANDGIIFPSDDLSLARVDPRHRLASHPGEGADLSFQGEPLGCEVPMLQSVLVPLGAPPPAPCIRQTLQPRIAGDRHGFPLRFDLAWHRNAWRICSSMGLNLRFFARPYPLGRGVDVADDRLTTISDIDVLDDHALLAPRSIVLQGRHLRGERARQLIEGPLGGILLLDTVDARQAAGEGHRGHVDSRHLSSEHRLDLIARLDAFNHREHEIDGFFGRPLPFAGINELQRQTIAKA
jgi:hypothetical protein